jgi:DNA repair exonuclease SbcCD ATPase subunit
MNCDCVLPDPDALMNELDTSVQLWRLYKTLQQELEVRTQELKENEGIETTLTETIRKKMEEKTPYLKSAVDKYKENKEELTEKEAELLSRLWPIIYYLQGGGKQNLIDLIAKVTDEDTIKALTEAGPEMPDEIGNYGVERLYYGGLYDACKNLGLEEIENYETACERIAKLKQEIETLKREIAKIEEITDKPESEPLDLDTHLDLETLKGLLRKKRADRTEVTELNQGSGRPRAPLAKEIADFVPEGEESITVLVQSVFCAKHTEL